MYVILNGENILSVYSPFSDRVGLPLHNTPFPGVLMKSIGAAYSTMLEQHTQKID